MLLKDRVAIVTGGAHGIGRAIAAGFAKEGARVVIADIDAAGAAETLREVEKAGAKGIFVETDVSDKSSVQAMAAGAGSAFGGGIDILVNCAAYVKSAPLEESEISDWDKTLAVNLRGTLFCIQAVLDTMRARRYGKIINLTSLAAIRGRPGQHAYCAASAGIWMLTEIVANLAGKDGVFVNALCPGLIDTGFDELYRMRDEAVYEKRVANIPLGRVGKPEDIVGAALYLASGLSDYSTGSMLIADGGMQVYLTAQNEI